MIKTNRKWGISNSDFIREQMNKQIDFDSGGDFFRKTNLPFVACDIESMGKNCETERKLKLVKFRHVKSNVCSINRFFFFNLYVIFAMIAFFLFVTFEEIYQEKSYSFEHIGVIVVLFCKTHFVFPWSSKLSQAGWKRARPHSIMSQF